MYRPLASLVALSSLLAFVPDARAQAPPVTVTLAADEAQRMANGTPLVALLVTLFSKAKVPYLIGPDIQGIVCYSPDTSTFDLSKTVGLIASSYSSPIVYEIRDGVHIVRRAYSTPVAPQVNVNVQPPPTPSVSVGSPKVSVQPMTFTRYEDALKWQLSSLRAERMALDKMLNTPKDEIAGLEVRLRFYELELARLRKSEKPAPPAKTAVKTARR